MNEETIKEIFSAVAFYAIDAGKELKLEKGKESIYRKASVAEARENGKKAERQVDWLVPVGSYRRW